MENCESVFTPTQDGSGDDDDVVELEWQALVKLARKEEEYQQSLGQPLDCVGWTRLQVLEEVQ